MATSINQKLAKSTLSIIESLRIAESEERVKFEQSEVVTTYMGNLLDKEKQLSYFKMVWETAKRVSISEQMTHFKAFVEMGDLYNAWSSLLGDFDYLNDRGVVMSCNMPLEVTFAKRYWYKGDILSIHKIANSYTKEGNFVSYHRNGQVNESGLFYANDCDGELLEYFEEGGLKLSAFFSYGKKNGNEIRYFKSGMVERIIPYKNAVIHGEYSTYHPCGAMDCRMPFVDGLKEGRTFQYDENGEWVSSWTYKKGLIVH